MVLVRDLLNMQFKMFTVRDTPAPNSDPKISKKIMGPNNYADSSWTVVTLNSGQDSPMSHLLTGPSPNCGLGSGEVIDFCFALLGQGKVGPPDSPPPQKSCS